MPNEQTSVPLFASGEVLTAANMNISAGTGVPVFATTVTRDAAFGGTSEKVLAEGQLCYLSSTNVVQYYDGAAWATVGPASAGALTFIKSQTIGTTVTSVNVTSAFSTTYDRYLVTLSGGTTTNNRSLNLTLGATTTGYYSSYALVSYASTTVIGGASSNGSSILDAAVVTTNGLSGRFELNNPFNAVRTEILNCYGGLVTNQQYLSGAGFVDNATSYTDFTLTMASTGTMTGGTIYVYGYAKA
jgi:hypothetical protein